MHRVRQKYDSPALSQECFGISENDKICVQECFAILEDDEVCVRECFCILGNGEIRVL